MMFRTRVGKYNYILAYYMVYKMWQLLSNAIDASNSALDVKCTFSMYTFNIYLVR